jgi:hypothetical protein
MVVLLERGKVAASGSPAQILNDVPGVLGVMDSAERPTALAWRRGVTWRVWAPAGALPAGARPVAPDFEDAVVAATLARGHHEQGR